jgi:hypothetical protein
VLGMMLPGALRSSHGAATFSLVHRSRRPGAWARCVDWTSGYLVVWFGVLLVAACAMVVVHLHWPPGSAASRAIGPAALALCAGAVQMRHVFVATLRRPRATEAAPPAVHADWWSGTSAGVHCVARCALPMIALHAIYGMSLAAMAAYALIAWWHAGSRSPWPHAVAGVVLICSAAMA